MHWLAVLAVSLLALLAAADSHGDDSNPVVLIVGDSISAGLGVPVDKQWPLILEQKLQVEFPQLTVAVAAISGDTTSSGRGRLPSLLTTHAPTVTILALGGNDALRGTPLPLVKNNLIAMIDAAKNSNSEVALAGMQIPPNYGPTYTEGFRRAWELLRLERNPFFNFAYAGVCGVDPNDADWIAESIETLKRYPLRNIRWGYTNSKRADVVRLPKEAVIRELRSAHVFVAKDNVAEKREVTLGLEEGDYVEAIAGVQTGEQVIVLGQGGLKNGSEIEILTPTGDEIRES